MVGIARHAQKPMVWWSSYLSCELQPWSTAVHWRSPSGNFPKTKDINKLTTTMHVQYLCLLLIKLFKFFKVHIIIANNIGKFMIYTPKSVTSCIIRIKQIIMDIILVLVQAIFSLLRTREMPSLWRERERGANVI